MFSSVRYHWMNARALCKVKFGIWLEGPQAPQIPPYCWVRCCWGLAAKQHRALKPCWHNHKDQSENPSQDVMKIPRVPPASLTSQQSPSPTTNLQHPLPSAVVPFHWHLCNFLFASVRTAKWRDGLCRISVDPPPCLGTGIWLADHSRNFPFLHFTPFHPLM